VNPTARETNSSLIEADSSSFVRPRQEELEQLIKTLEN